MSNDIETTSAGGPAVSDALIRGLVVSLTTLVAFLVALFVFACMHPILFLFPAICLVGWVVLKVLSEILARV